MSQTAPRHATQHRYTAIHYNTGAGDDYQHYYILMMEGSQMPPPISYYLILTFRRLDETKGPFLYLTAYMIYH